MLKNLVAILLVSVALLGPIGSRAANPILGKPAPNFSLVDLSDRLVKLDDFKEKNLVLIFYVDYN
jgi:hypothetical protein